MKRITALESRLGGGQVEDNAAVPDAVKEVYDRMLSLIRESKREDVVRALAWLVHLGGSADANLICRAAYVEPDMASLDDDLVDSPEGVTDASVGFITLGTNWRGYLQFRFAHETCRDYFYLCADTSSWPTMLAQTSLTYLAFERSTTLWTGTGAYYLPDDNLFVSVCRFLLSDMEGVNETQTQHALERFLHASGLILGDFMLMVTREMDLKLSNLPQYVEELATSSRFAVKSEDVSFGSLKLLTASCIGHTRNFRNVIRGVISHTSWRMAFMLCAYFGREHFMNELFNMCPDTDWGIVFNKARATSYPSVLAQYDSNHFVGRNLPDAELLISRGASLEALDNDRCTPLHVAAHKGRVFIIKLLIERGVHMDAVDDRQRTPLHVAAYARQNCTAQLLIENGAPLDVVDDNHYTPLHVAIRRGMESIADLLIKHDMALDVVAGHRYSWTLLHCAASSGMDSIAKILIERGAPLEAVDDAQRTALRVAIDYGMESAAKFFMKHGARCDRAYDKQRTALHVAIDKRMESLAQLLIEDGAPLDGVDFMQCTPLHAAVYGRMESIAKSLIQRGAPLDAVDSKQRTPLHVALYYGMDLVAKLLIERGASLDPLDDRQRTPLHVAAYQRSEPIAQLLIKRGAPLDILDDTQRIPLHVADDKGMKSVTKPIIERSCPLVMFDEGMIRYV
jgi:ankyrin repeat protein